MIESKDYIEREYKQAVDDFKLAKTEDERLECRKILANLVITAKVLFGTAYADSLKNNIAGEYEE